MKRHTICLCALVLLTACGGGGAVTTEPFGGRQIKSPLAPSVSADFVNQSRTLQAAVSAAPRRELFFEPSLYLVPGFDGYVRNFTGEATILFESFDDHSVIQVFAGTDTTGGNNAAFRGFNLETEDGAIATSGTAAYDGNYAGLLTTLVPGVKTESYITGVVALAIDFEAGTANGTITERTRSLIANGMPAATHFGNVTLGQLTFENGVYVTPGQTTGGQLDNANAVPDAATGQLSGAWGLLFGGPDGARAVGFVEIDHDYIQDGGGISSDFNEIGVFTTRD